MGLLFAGKPWCWLAIVPLMFLLWLISFFRNPPRKIPDDPRAIVSPADGTVVDVTPLAHYDFIGGPAVRIGIFLSIFNVHINRAPLAGRVVELHYHPGEFLNAMRPESAERNEFMWIGFEQTEPPSRRFAVRQISGMLARRIVCTLEPGQTVTRGENFGMIKLGSRTELILPAETVEITVQHRRSGSAPAAISSPAGNNRLRLSAPKSGSPTMKPIRAVAVCRRYLRSAT